MPSSGVRRKRQAQRARKERETSAESKVPTVILSKTKADKKAVASQLPKALAIRHEELKKRGRKK